jgi:hypothetical protein
MAGNQVTLTLAGDSAKLEKAFANTQASAAQMQQQVGGASSRMQSAFDRVNGSAVFLTEGISGLGDSIHTITNLQRDAADRADRLARAQNEVSQAANDMEQAFADARQATLDLAQSQRDAAQSGIDVEQALLDSDKAAKDYADAIKEHGANSIEARQAAIDMKQAQEDLAQAHEDAKQATEDGEQALLDNKQAAIDAKDATLNLSEAQRNAVEPSGITVWTDRLSALAPVVFTVIGAMQLFTAATWSSTVALLASPVTWITLLVIGLIAVIVLIATKTTWFQDAWKASWGWIKRTAVDVWDWLKTLPDKIGNSFKAIANFISWPFRTAFNLISDAWNKTIGSLHWNVPNWIPLIGGNSISAPRLPKFHTGGVVPGAPGTEQLAILQAGERVSPVGSSGGAMVLELRSSGSAVDDMLVEILSRAIRVRGGNAQLVLGVNRG